MCFVNGQFIACIVLGFSVVERSFAARLHLIDKDVPGKAIDLLKAAKSQGWLNDDEYVQLDVAREYRNPVTHFRDTLNPSRPDIRAFPFGKGVYDVLELDAKHVLSAAIMALNKTSI
ncbi:MAG TPA: hypothetical protein VIM35_06100 [Gallionella sp.]